MLGVTNNSCWTVWSRLHQYLALASVLLQRRCLLQRGDGKNIHIDGKGAGHGSGGSVVPTISAGGVSKVSSRASMAGDMIV